MATEPESQKEVAIEQVSNSRQPLSILDLLLVTLIVAVHLFHFPLAVRYRASQMMYLVPLIPTLITIWIHIRLRLKVLHAIIVHYIVSVFWAFLWGVGYALAATHEPGSSYFEDPVEMGAFCSVQMMLPALFTTFVYAWVAVCIKYVKVMVRMGV